MKKVFKRFAPDETMRIYGRGIRRRIASMLSDHPRQLRMAMSLLYSLPGLPLLAYGDEIGMGDNPDLPGREAVRPPMQWTAEPTEGFSKAPTSSWFRPPVTLKGFDSTTLNVHDQENKPDSMLNFVRHLNHTRRAFPGLSCGEHEWIPTDNSQLAAHLSRWCNENFLIVHNLGATPCSAHLELNLIYLRELVHIFGDPIQPKRISERALQIETEGYGFAWFRLRNGKV